MIKEDIIQQEINSKNIEHYKNYVKDIKNGDLIEISPFFLMKGSHKKITAICCNNECCYEKILEYRRYYSYTKGNVEEYYCKKCSYIKAKKTNLERYGVEYTFQSETIKDKIKETNIERYGVEHVAHSEEIKKKRKETNIERYGVEYVFQSDIFKDKTKKTNLEKYGVEHISKLDTYKEKRKDYWMNMCGVESNLMLDSTKEKIKETNLERYGFYSSMQSKVVQDKMKDTKYKFLYDKFKNGYDNNNEYEFIDYKKDNGLTLKHIRCGNIFEVRLNHIYDRSSEGSLCSVCYIGNTSNNEIVMRNFLINNNIIFTESDRTILDGKELDIYIPSHNLAIEFNGLYWHSEKHKDEKYHLNKSLICQEKGIHLMHIWEDESVYKLDIIKSIILNKLNKIENRIFARKCIIKEVKDTKLIRNFLDTNHIQGYSQSSIKLGLYYNGELVSLMTFGYRHTNKKKEFELIRFCNILNSNVVGASSKLFKYFLNNYSENNILSYSDFRLFDGKMYETLGFKKIHLSKPDYFWCKKLERKHRFNFNKQKLIKDGYDPNKTEVVIMHERGYYRIWSCGQVRWEYNK
jgi:hypothetical protein